MKNDTEYEGGEEAPELIAKDTANYGPGMDGQDCLACENFKEPDRCKKVRGEISPTGTCDLFEGANNIPGLDMDEMGIDEFLFGAGEE